jgi:thiamine-phosphate pyrophosphorylase
MARYGEARDILGGRFIVGADAGRSRHDAMTLGEAGADYVGFGIPAHVEDRESARSRRLELVGWWSEIFEVPCVAFDVETAEEAARLAAAGADFVALRAPALPAAELARWGEDVMRALSLPEAAARPPCRGWPRSC